MNTKESLSKTMAELGPKVTPSEAFLQIIAMQNERIIDLLERIEVDTVELVRTLTNIAEAGL